VLPQIPGREHARHSNEAFHLGAAAGARAGGGGGYISLEFASIFHGLGVKTTLYTAGSALCAASDTELGERIEEEMKAKGIEPAFRAASRSPFDAPCERDLEVAYSDGRTRETGLGPVLHRRKRTAKASGLERAGVKSRPKATIIVDKFSAQPRLRSTPFGDVTTHQPHASHAEAMWLAPALRGERAVDHENVPPRCSPIRNIATRWGSRRKGRSATARWTSTRLLSLPSSSSSASGRAHLHEAGGRPHDRAVVGRAHDRHRRGAK